MRLQLLSLPIWAMLTAVSAIPTATKEEQPTLALEAPIEGYSMVPIQWDVEITPGGDRLQVNGTLETVIAELKVLNPNWEEDFLPKVETRNVEKRAEWTHHYCNHRNDWSNAKAGWILEQGVPYLRGLSGNPTMAPRACGRVSCSYKSGITWCNDNNYQKTLNSWREIADGAERLVNACSDRSSPFRGQIFEKYAWNTIVHGDNC